MCARTKEGWTGWRERTGFKGVEMGGVEGVKESLPTGRVQADVVHGAGKDEERLAVQEEGAAVVGDRGCHCRVEGRWGLQ